MLTEADGLGQGAKRSYLEQPGIWRAYDDALFGALAKVQAPPQLSDLERIETEGIVRGATFFNEFTPDKLAERQAFHTRCIATFADRDLVFFDPDNGLEVKSVPKGRKRSNKYVFLDEIADHYAAGRSVLVYQQLGRKLPRKEFVEEKAAKLWGSCLARQGWHSTQRTLCSCWRPGLSMRSGSSLPRLSCSGTARR
jgi:hypothetical protein